MYDEEIKCLSGVTTFMGVIRRAHIHVRKSYGVSYTLWAAKENVSILDCEIKSMKVSSLVV